jgi:hypothetical protein
MQPLASDPHSLALRHRLLLAQCSASQTLATGVNITATEQFNNSPVKIVLPGQHEQSYLWLKVTDAAGISGQRMPFNGDPLDSCLADAIAGWIDAGAQND